MSEEKKNLSELSDSLVGELLPPQEKKEPVEVSIPYSNDEEDDFLALPLKNEELLRTKWFQNIMADTENITRIVNSLSKKDVQSLRKYLFRKVSNPSADAVLICSGDSCPIKADCWFRIEKKVYPLGLRCPIEEAKQRQIVRQYADEFEVKDFDYAKIEMICELALLDLYEGRMAIVLAAGDRGGLIVDQNMGYADDGTPIVNKAIAPEFEIQERIRYRRDKIFRSLVGTPYEQYKRDAALKKRTENDTLQKGPEAKEKWDAYLENARNKNL